MSRIVDLADALVFKINQQAWSTPFTAVRAYAVGFDVADLAGIKVTVVPRAVEHVTAARGINRDDLQIDIGVQKKLGDDWENAIGDLLTLSEEIGDYIRTTRTFDYPPVPALNRFQWVRSETSPIYSREHLKELRVFTGVLTCTFGVMF